MTLVDDIHRIKYLSIVTYSEARRAHAAEV
jgi:hypothetical protein